MPCLKKCCYCIKLRTGCFILSYFNLVVVVLVLVIDATNHGIILAQRIGKEKNHLVIFGSYLALNVLSMVFLIVAVIGLHMKNAALKAYFGYSILCLITHFMVFMIQCLNYSDDLMEIGKGVATIIFIYVYELYCLIVIASYIVHGMRSSEERHETVQ